MSLLNDRVYDTIVGKEGVPLDRIRGLFHGSFKSFATPDSPFKGGGENNCYWFTTGFESSFFNAAAIYNHDPLIFEEIIKVFYEKNLPHSISLAGAGLLHAETLKARGYVNKGAAPSMAYALDPKKDHHELRSGLEVRRVETEADLQIIVELLTIGFEMPAEYAQALSRGPFGNANSFRYCLFDNGVPVSTTLFVRTGNFIGCFDVLTPAEHQRKGYGDELMGWALAQHAELGDELVVLIATEAGQPLYRRRGFQFLEYIQSWVMEDTSLMRRFTHHELQIGPYKLRPLQEDDAEVLLPLYNDEAILQWMGIANPFTEKDHLDYLKIWRDSQRNGSGINWLIELDGAPVGQIWLRRTNWKLKISEIGYLAFPASRGLGIIPTVTRYLAELLLNEYEMERVEIWHSAENLPSRRAAEKAGFTYEGTMRRFSRNLGEVTDNSVLSMIKDDLTR